MNRDIPTIPPSSGAEDPAVLGALASLPREQASPGFTAAVLERSRTAEKPAAELGWSRTTTLLAASLVLVTVVTAGMLERAHQKKELRGRVDALRSEHEMLEHELAELKRASAEEPAVVYLGGDENVDVVLTFDPKAVPATSSGAVAPVAASGNHGI